MRVLGLETSTRRGSVALVEDDAVVCERCHEAPNAHAEHMLRLVDEVFSEAAWERTALDRIAVGTGPGSFTGLRIGIALAQGVALGLDRPLVGVGSLRAMAAAVPGTVRGIRCAMLDARRDQRFLALYDESGFELAEPRAIASTAVGTEVERLRQHPAPPGATWPDGLVAVGEVPKELIRTFHVHRGGRCDLPHAAETARLGAALPADAVAEANYVRPADAIRPNLPPSPLS